MSSFSFNKNSHICKFSASAPYRISPAALDLPPLRHFYHYSPPSSKERRRARVCASHEDGCVKKTGRGTRQTDHVVLPCLAFLMHIVGPGRLAVSRQAYCLPCRFLIMEHTPGFVAQTAIQSGEDLCNQSNPAIIVSLLVRQRW